MVSSMKKTKTILITGANKGIGFAIVKALLEQFPETHLFFSCRDKHRSVAAINSLTSIVPGSESRLDAIIMDVSNRDSIQSAASQIEYLLSQKGLRLYGIVNNAGIMNSPTGVEDVVRVNTLGPKYVLDYFYHLIEPDIGRVVNVTSAAGPNYLSRCNDRTRKILTHREVTWEQILELTEEFIRQYQESSDSEKELLNSNVYGFSKACTNALTMQQARSHTTIKINSCTPGFIETDMTLPIAQNQGKSPQEMGMKAPAEGTRSCIHLLMNDVTTGHYFGSDCVRSPIDRYRAPGTPAFNG